MKTLRAAFISYSRLPVGYHDLEKSHFSNSLVYLPVVGIAVGALAALVYYLASFVFTPPIAVFFALVFSVLATGALHEDGFADCCDGFGASTDKERILAIMKDSANGSYAMLGVAFLLLAKFIFLSQISPESQITALFTMHVFARLSPLLIVSTSSHCHSKNSKMSADMVFSGKQLLSISGLVLLAALYLLPWVFVLQMVSGLLILTFACRWYFIKRLEGYNGDCLGASEQLSECLILLLFASYF